MQNSRADFYLAQLTTAHRRMVASYFTNTMRLKVMPVARWGQLRIQYEQKACCLLLALLLT